LFSLGSQYVNDFLLPGEKPKHRVPIDIEQCTDCTLVQAKHTAPQEFMYSRFYWYRSGVTETMRGILQGIADLAGGYLQPGDTVLDIGSNDGTLLRSYPEGMYTTVGVEPAVNLAEEGTKGVDVFINDFWTASNYRDHWNYPAKVVTAIGMFYDLEDPNQFIGDIAEVMDEDGVFIAQLMCLYDTVVNRDVGNFSHEHLEFYTFKSLEHLYQSNGLEIIDVEHNSVNGGSYLITARKTSGEVIPLPRAAERIARVREQELMLEDLNTYCKFKQDLLNNKAKTVTFIKHAKQRGQSVWVYGASTKGNVILQYYGLNSITITGAAERSPEKYGRVTVGTNIPIFSEEQARAERPDYFLVLPYAFIDEFVAREQKFLQQGGKFIVPLPKFTVIGASR
jgi:hypothetical protein